MLNPLSKTPFLSLLIPLIIGIVLQYYLLIQDWSVVVILLGIAAMLFSYLIPEKKLFTLRWLFGAGASLFLIGVGIISTSISQDYSSFVFSDAPTIYRGIVLDTPQDKPRSIACKVELVDFDKQIVCYFQRDSLTKSQLNPGDEFLFKGNIKPFRNMGNPDDFDYVRYMYNQGFAGWVYLPSHQWQIIGEVSSLKTKALRYRQYIMEFYKALGFSDSEYAILSALTLGYQDALSDDLKQSFRTTGTVHVLSVSGLHVGIIYAMIGFLLSFIPRRSTYYKFKPIFIILLLWLYAFITGLPPSVVRASIMLTVFCISEIFNKKNYPIHTLYIAAFFMLLVAPFSLFDIGFQLSCISVLAILCLHPKTSKLIDIKNKYLKSVWQMFTLSLVAQLGTFPLCLYYFGTFPTYFFIANLIIVPLVSLITYSMAGIAGAKLLSCFFSDFSFYFFIIPVKLLKFLVELMTTSIKFIENIPYALIDNAKISFEDLLLILLLIVSFLIFIIHRKPKSLIVGLISILILLIIHIHHSLEQKTDSMIIYNRRNSTEIALNISKQHYVIKHDDIVDGYMMINIKRHKILIVTSNIWNKKQADIRYEVDYLLLANDNTLSLYSLTQMLVIHQVVLDASLSTETIKRLSDECQNLNIPCYDVTQKGAYTLIF